MKKIISVLLLSVALLSISASSNAQSQVYEVQHTTLNVGGSFNTGNPAQLNYAVSALPLATKLDTVNNAGTDSFKAKIVGDYSSITFQVNVLKISGTDTGTINIYANIDGSSIYTKIGSVGLVSNITTTQQFLYTVNSGYGHNPYSSYCLVFTGSGTESNSWQGKLLIR